MLVKSDSKFWQDVGNAHDHVAANHQRELTVARNGMEAKVSFVDMGDQGDNVILIRVKATNTEVRETLIVP